MRFRTFLLRTYGPNCYCVMSIIGHKNIYMQLSRILQDTDSKEIYLVGNCFTELQPVFTTQFGSSTDIGMTYVINGLTSNSSCKFPLSHLKAKCFVFPVEGDGKLACVEYLH